MAKSLNQILIETLSCIAPVFPDTYTGKEPKYITFNFSAVPDDFSDNEPHEERYSVQVHFIAPQGENVLADVNRIKHLLFAAGFDFPDYTNVHQNEIYNVSNTIQHHCFETQYILRMEREWDHSAY